MAWILALKRTTAIFYLTLFLIVAVLPLAVMLFGTFVKGQTIDFNAYKIMFQSIQNRRILGNSITLAFLTAFFSLLIGILPGYLFSKTDLPLKRFFTLLLTIPIFLPSYILSISWTHILGKQGLFQTWFSVGSYTSQFLYSLPGAAFVLSNTYYPLVMLISMAAFHGIDAGFEDEARLHIGEVRILASVLAPLAFPFLKAAARFSGLLAEMV